MNLLLLSLLKWIFAAYVSGPMLIEENLELKLLKLIYFHLENYVEFLVKSSAYLVMTKAPNHFALSENRIHNIKLSQKACKTSSTWHSNNDTKCYTKPLSFTKDKEYPREFPHEIGKRVNKSHYCGSNGWPKSSYHRTLVTIPQRRNSRRLFRLHGCRCGPQWNQPPSFYTNEPISRLNPAGFILRSCNLHLQLRGKSVEITWDVHSPLDAEINTIGLISLG